MPPARKRGKRIVYGPDEVNLDEADNPNYDRNFTMAMLHPEKYWRMWSRAYDATDDVDAAGNMLADLEKFFGLSHNKDARDFLVAQETASAKKWIEDKVNLDEMKTIHQALLQRLTMVQR